MSYTEMLNDAFADEVMNHNWSVSQVIEVLIERQPFESDLGFDRCCKEIPNYEYISQWYKDVIKKRMVMENITEADVKKSVGGTITFKGCRFTASVLSKITGLTVSTIYKYWQNAEKNPILFEKAIANRVDESVLEYYANRQGKVDPPDVEKPKADLELEIL